MTLRQAKKRELPARWGVPPGVLGAGAALVTLLWGMTAQAAPDVAARLLKEGEVPQASGPMMWTFWILGALTVIGAVATITRRNPVMAAVCLVGTLCASAGLYLLLHATFMAAIQVMVYAGAIMVLFIFVIMAVEHPEHEETGLMQSTGTKVLGLIAIALLFFRTMGVLVGPGVKSAGLVSDTYGNVSTLGKLLFSDYLFPFEAISILLLVAIIGAVVVSRHRTRQEG